MNIFGITFLTLETLIFPEWSLPLWVTKVHLSWWKASTLVSILSLPVLFVFFWPQHALRFFPKETRQKIIIFFQKFKEKIIFWLKSRLQKTYKIARSIFQVVVSFNSIDYLSSYLVHLFVELLFLSFFVVDLISKTKKDLEARHKKAYKRLVVILCGLGYLGVIIGAGVPYIPGFRQAGLATAIIINKWQAKILFIVVDFIRLFIEGYILSKI